MSLADTLTESTEAFVVAGIGGARKGQYQIGEHTGSFRRSESRLVLFDALDNRKGATEFTLSGPHVEGRIEANCTMRERNLNLGVLSFRRSGLRTAAISP